VANKKEERQRVNANAVDNLCGSRSSSTQTGSPFLSSVCEIRMINHRKRKRDAAEKKEKKEKKKKEESIRLERRKRKRSPASPRSSISLAVP